MPIEQPVVLSGQQLAAYAAWSTLLLGVFYLIVRLTIKGMIADLVDRLDEKYQRRDIAESERHSLAERIARLERRNALSSHEK